jgi:hypothetical protein
MLQTVMQPNCYSTTLDPCGYLLLLHFLRNVAVLVLLCNRGLMPLVDSCNDLSWECWGVLSSLEARALLFRESNFFCSLLEMINL